MQTDLPTTDLGVDSTSQETTAPVETKAPQPDLSQLSGLFEQLGKVKTEEVETPEEETKPEAMPRLEVDESYSEEVQTTLHMLNFIMPDVDLRQAFGQALEEGDASRIDLRELRRAYGDTPELDHVVRTLESIVESVGSVAESAYTEVFDSVGGKEQWQGIATFFNQNATPTEIAIAKKLTTSRNPEEIKEGAKYVVEFAQRAGAVPKTPSKLTTGTSGTTGMGLSQEAFIEAYNELRNSPEWDRNPRAIDEQVAELDRLRAIGIRNGL